MKYMKLLVNLCPWTRITHVGRIILIDNPGRKVITNFTSIVFTRNTMVPDMQHQSFLTNYSSSKYLRYFRGVNLRPNTSYNIRTEYPWGKWWNSFWWRFHSIFKVPTSNTPRGTMESSHNNEYGIIVPREHWTWVYDVYEYY